MGGKRRWWSGSGETTSLLLFLLLGAVSRASETQLNSRPCHTFLNIYRKKQFLLNVWETKTKSGAEKKQRWEVMARLNFYIGGSILKTVYA